MEDRTSKEKLEQKIDEARIKKIQDNAKLKKRTGYVDSVVKNTRRLLEKL